MYILCVCYRSLISLKYLWDHRFTAIRLYSVTLAFLLKVKYITINFVPFLIASDWPTYQEVKTWTLIIFYFIYELYNGPPMSPPIMGENRYTPHLMYTHCRSSRIRIDDARLSFQPPTTTQMRNGVVIKQIVLFAI